MVIPILMHLCSFVSKLKRCKPHKAARHPTICDVINDVKLFPTVYHRIYCRKFLTLSNQKSRYTCYKSKCIRIVVYRVLGNVMTSIITLRKIRENFDVFTPNMHF